MTAPAGPTTTEAALRDVVVDPLVTDTAEALRAHYAKRIRWAQHCRRPEAAEQVADEIVRDLVRSFGGAR